MELSVFFFFSKFSSIFLKWCRNSLPILSFKDKVTGTCENVPSYYCLQPRQKKQSPGEKGSLQ